MHFAVNRRSKRHRTLHPRHNSPESKDLLHHQISGQIDNRFARAPFFCETMRILLTFSCLFLLRPFVSLHTFADSVNHGENTSPRSTNGFLATPRARPVPNSNPVLSRADNPRSSFALVDIRNRRRYRTASKVRHLASPCRFCRKSSFQ